MATYQHTVALFKEYKAENDKRKIVELLESFLRECPDADDMQICWAFWNLSDNYAMLRDASEEYRNHKLFEKKLMHMDEKYLHWIVSDGTQKLTLLTGGYEAYWNALYRYACEKAPKREDNAVIRFESHRANVAFPSVVDYSFDAEHARFALENLANSCSELQHTSGALYYQLTYYTMAIGFNTLMKEDNKPLIEESYAAFTEILPYLHTEKQTYADGEERLLGTYDQLNAPRAKYNQAFCGIHNYIIQLVNAGAYQLALQCNALAEPVCLDYGSYYKRKLQTAREGVLEH